jgi:coiled-coil domain-containing protein 55
MSHFYRQLLNEAEVQHEATVSAAQQTSSAPGAIKGPQGASQNLTITRPPDMAPKSDVEVARIAREQGKEVELNDDNQIIDKRELLSAGLNLSMPNTRQFGLRTAMDRKRENDSTPSPIHTAVGTAASRREINNRRQREIDVQLREEQERIREEKERADEERMARVAAKRNNEEDIKSAKERYLERKRRKLAETGMEASTQEH